MATKPQQAPKYPQLTYPKDAVNSQLNPDKYELWKKPKDLTAVRSEIVAMRREEFLEMAKMSNPKNAARFKQSWANELTVRMNEGDFALMDTVEFDWNGQLANGHHRVAGGSKCNAVVLINVVYGLNPENYYKYDDNYKRTGGNVIGIHLNLPKKEADSCSAAANWTILYWDGEGLEARKFISKGDRLDFVDKHPDMPIYLKTIHKWGKEVGKKTTDLPVSDSVLLALMTLGSEVNKNLTREFIKGVIQNDGLKNGSPIKVYHDFLVAAKQSTGSGRKVNTSERVGKGLYAMREYFDGNSIQQDAQGRYPLKFRAKDGEEGITRLSDQQDEFFLDFRREMKANQKNKLAALLNPTNKLLTEISVVVEAEFLSKRIGNALTKMGVKTIADLMAFTDTALTMALKHAYVEEIKDLLRGMDLKLKKA